jgi:hypothetical protein
MNFEDFEQNINKHDVKLSEMLSAIIETEAENQALLLVILRNQALMFQKMDPSKTALEYEDQFVDLVNKEKNLKLAKLVDRLSK